ncbi:MAG TPA: ATP-binding protein [Caldisericia bacterium]|nr:ATP-binding protein [Caldisericia bacterium]
MLIPRVYDDLGLHLREGKVLVIYGPRRVGKSTLLQQFYNHQKCSKRMVSGDDISVQEALGSQLISIISSMVEKLDLFVIDEAQRIPHIGLGLKILIDTHPTLKVIATGSASFDLQNKIGEPLTGRKKTLCLYPLSNKELGSIKTPWEMEQSLEDRLVYGSYPEIITASTHTERQSLLNEITLSYLLKDILELERVKGAKVLYDLLRLLAFQVGSEVSLSELASSVGLDKNTVARYLDLFEKAFVLYNLRGFSRNLRKEITKKSKYYFYDNGIRNALIANFNSLSLRDDQGKLWENYLVMERIKKQAYTPLYSNNYFWRTWDQKEIDWIEEREGKLFAFEFKYKSTKTNKTHPYFKSIYPEAVTETITKENYSDFIR